MSLRGVNELVIHLESFRNIELWYQGAYFLSISIYFQNLKQKVYAHPFAHTEHFHSPAEQMEYDQQIIKPSLIEEGESKFLSKVFLVKYYEEEIELNDICHFRIEWDLAQIDYSNLIMEADLYFCDVGKKGIYNQDLMQKEAKFVKRKKFFLFDCLKGIHEYCPIIYDENYFCLINSTIHSTCIDYRFRSSPLQLSQFAKLTYSQKMKLVEANRAKEDKKISYYYSIIKDLNLPDKAQSLKAVELILIEERKKNYEVLLHSYKKLFQKVISENDRKVFANRLVAPNSLCLCEEDRLVKRNSVGDDHIFSKYKSRNPEQIIERMLEEANSISAKTIRLWHCYIDLFRVSPRFAMSYLQSEYTHKKKAFWEKLIFVKKVKTINLALSDGDSTEIEKKLLTEKLKTKISLQIQEESFVEKRENLPVLICHQYELESKKMPKKEQSDQDEGIHLIVFVHGFQGNSYDMKVIKNHVSFLYPESMFLCATSNQEMTETDIMEMGNRLASEVKTYVIENFPQNTLGRLSFVGHSLGGVKIRAALPKLLEYKEKFHCLMTFSSPHLGYGINTSSVIDVGLWFLKKMKDSECLRQLSMTDNENLEETCLYKLSLMPGFEYFSHIFLFSSKQDSYAPFESARIQVDLNYKNDKKKQLHYKMVKNILKNVKSEVLRRVDVLFKISQKNLDSLIGRTAHIMFLENHDLMKALLYTEPNLFA